MPRAAQLLAAPATPQPQQACCPCHRSSPRPPTTASSLAEGGGHQLGPLQSHRQPRPRAAGPGRGQQQQQVRAVRWWGIGHGHRRGAGCWGGTPGCSACSAWHTSSLPPTAHHPRCAGCSCLAHHPRCAGCGCLAHHPSSAGTPCPAACSVPRPHPHRCSRSRCGPVQPRVQLAAEDCPWR